MDPLHKSSRTEALGIQVEEEQEQAIEEVSHTTIMGKLSDLLNSQFGIEGRPGRGRNPRTPKKQPTAEELDAELEAYTKEMK